MKLFYYKEKEKPICYYETNEQIVIPEKYQEKEMRAFWVSTVVNIDLPIMENELTYKNKLDEMFDVAKEFNINAIFFQVRPLNDAFYKSDLNPYSKFIMGKEDKEPLFDVLEYVVKKGKELKIEIHAWCNPYRVSLNNELDKKAFIETLSDKNFAKKRPDLVIRDSKNQFILNPVKEEVKKFIIDSMLEILDKYDVSGIHWDDYFYPYAPLSEDDNDLGDFELRENKSQSLEEYRRFHITDVIKRLNIEIKNKNNKIKFGLSPFGIWRSIKNDLRGSNSAASTSQSYDNQYADSYDWVKNEYIDYIVPQLYWEFGHPVAPFADLAKWWNNLVEGTNVKLYIGLGIYRQGREGEYENPLEVVNQIKYVNNLPNVSGEVFFTYHNFKNKEEVSYPGVLEVKKLLGGKNE